MEILCLSWWISSTNNTPRRKVSSSSDSEMFRIGFRESKRDKDGGDEIRFNRSSNRRDEDESERMKGKGSVTNKYERVFNLTPFCEGFTVSFRKVFRREGVFVTLVIVLNSFS